MPTYYLKVTYTLPNGMTGELMGTQTIAQVDGRFGPERATETLIDNARFIAGWDRPQDGATFSLEGITPASMWLTNKVLPLPNGRKHVAITPMTLAERREYLSNGGKVHP